MVFGFTRCVSTCPPALGVARQVLHALGPGDTASVVFVTLDPLSDDAPALRAYLGAIDSRIIGLTGHPARIEQTAERFGVAVRGAGSALEHSAMWYLLDADAVLRRVYGPTTPADHLVADIRRLQGAAL
jgi:protein SCO1/2